MELKEFHCNEMYLNFIVFTCNIKLEFLIRSIDIQIKCGLLLSLIYHVNFEDYHQEKN